MVVTAPARADHRTKDLVKRLLPGEIAIICHDDLDQVAAADLVAKKVSAVINTGKSISGKYPNLGPQTLLKANILLLDQSNKDIMKIPDRTVITIDSHGQIFHRQTLISKGAIITADVAEKQMKYARQNIGRALDRFIDNTLSYAKQEKAFITGQLDIPVTTTIFQGRQVLIVARGENFRQDLAAIRDYIDDIRPVLIGVDGGADILMDFGYRPDVIVGDMDSVSDKALAYGKEIIVHAYPNGTVPGLERPRQLGLAAKIFPCPGTSEDVALLLAYEKGADLIVAVGFHSSMVDFLEKGRQGMASTFLVRLKVGSILVDAKGVSRLYCAKLNARYLIGLFAAALIPMITLALTSTPMKHILKLLELKIRVVLGH